MDRSGSQQQLWEAMESCRAGSDDLHDPQFAELAAQLAADARLAGQFARLQRADAAIQAAFHDVPTPPGLADRVLQRLNDEQSATAAMPKPQIAKQYSRRRLLAGAASLSAAAALLAAVWLHLGNGRHDTPTSVLEETMQFFANDNATEGKLVSQLAPPADYPISRDLLSMRNVRWRHVAHFLGGPAVAYDLPSLGGRATLYVAVKSVPGLPAAAPREPEWGTGGSSAAAWQQGDKLYVLVVEGDAGTYQSYLDQSRGPLT